MMVSDTSMLLDPLRNKGTAFTEVERTALGLHGLLPAAVETLEQQLGREYAAFRALSTPLDKHLYLRALQDRNEVLFYRLLDEHLPEMLPIIYTPTVAEACASFSRTYRRPRGLFLSYPARDRMREALRNRPRETVDVIVVTDGERILGIGDQGIGGMGIPIGKLSLYTAIGGIDPARTLPVTLDVGTNDQRRLADPGYLGWRHPRVAGPEYLDFVDQFVAAVQAELPDVLLQWEDFAINHALPILDQYRDVLLTFNDDIQGTAAVTLATVASAASASGTPLSGQRILILGAGSAGVGVARYLAHALVGAGLPVDQARSRIVLMDIDGLIHDGRTDLSPSQAEFAVPVSVACAWSRERPGNADLAAVVDHFRPTTLVGLSTAPGAFTEEIVRSMAAQTRRPVILPLSNPSSRSEADPRDVFTWTDGRAIMATGSPFPDIDTVSGPMTVSQCNNAYIFPAMGLAAVAANVTHISDGLFIAAATELAALSPGAHDVRDGLLPRISDLKDITARIALAVAVQAVDEGLAPARSVDELAARIERIRWRPAYR